MLSCYTIFLEFLGCSNFFYSNQELNAYAKKNGIRLITRIHLLIASEKNSSLEDAQLMYVFLIVMKKKVRLENVLQTKLFDNVNDKKGMQNYAQILSHTV